MTISQKNKCIVCDATYDIENLYPLQLLRPSIRDLITRTRGKSSDRKSGFICMRDYAKLKSKFYRKSLTAHEYDLSELEQQVIEGIAQKDLVSTNTLETFVEQMTLGERIADRVSTFGGSWPFILFFIVTMIAWMIVNSIILEGEAFDAYPYILLNLCLSCLAALQAPIIMMSQNRRSDLDRIKAEEDYKVNLHSELMLEHINEKIDHFMISHWHEIDEIRENQKKILNKLTAPKAIKIKV